MAMVFRPMMRTALRQVKVAARAQWAPALRPTRAFGSAAGKKVAEIAAAELKHEEENYEKSKEVVDFLKTSPFKFMDEPGDVNLKLERKIGEKTVRIEWQLTNPFDPEAEVEGGEQSEFDHDSTELTVSVEAGTGQGMMFYCSTQTGEDHRYVIGMVKSFANQAEKDSLSCYNGPDFEDLDDKVQESLDEYLAEVGMSAEVCDFIASMAVDKEQREYVRWLTNVKEFMTE